MAGEKPENDTEKKSDTSDKQSDSAPKQNRSISPPRRFDAGKLFWGLLLVVIGTLALLDNFGVVEVSFRNLWRLWPLLLVVGGLSLLTLRDRFSRVVSIVFVILALTAVVIVALGGFATEPRELETSSVSVMRQEDVRSARVEYGGGAGTIRIGSADMDEVVVADLTSNFAELEQRTFVEDGIQVVDLDLSGERGEWWFGGDWRNELEMRLSRRLPLELVIETGAVDLEADLSELELTRLDVDTGASDVEFRLGSRARQTDVAIGAGASSVKILIPKDVAVRADVDGGLSSQELADLQDVGGGIYETEGYAQAENRISISADIGAASLVLERY